MPFARRHRWLTSLSVAALLFALSVGGFGVYLAGEAGRLPWQEEPTRIPITPFADIPGFSAPTRAATPAPAPASTEPAASVATQPSTSSHAPATGDQ